MAQTRHYNSFDFIRFFLASAVLVSHHYSLSGFPAPDVPLVNASVGRVAVFAFFAVSGFLMYNSLVRSQDFFFYFTSRTLRIVPNLFVAVATTSLALMVIFNNYENLDSHLYYIRKDAFSFIAPPYYWIEGLFTDRPDRGVNGSLWTLQYEFFMYIVIFGLFLLPKRLFAAALIGILAIASLPFFQTMDRAYRIATFHLHVGFLAQTGFHFLAGALIACYWERITSHKLIASVGSIVAIALLAVFAPGIKSAILFFAWIPFFILCLSPLASGFSKYGDASYGVYIYAFPIQQAAIVLIPDFWLSMTVSFILTTIIGYACWHGFEKRCLSQRKKVAASLSEACQKLTTALRAKVN
ncbi:acyltransferase [Aureimonas fodinaquatilis]|uniref:Acyltransferase n=1 Tax=Aureimonas fodinaquatilis TaxID=2565783 RepID=A0A5B0DU89_9HYPH|nr:acyltransferase [Aureimonas fodinaquatilis]KAA0970377.1 acyltransferase [Aureimonas fodinaquatilis]